VDRRSRIVREHAPRFTRSRVLPAGQSESDFSLDQRQRLPIAPQIRAFTNSSRLCQCPLRFVEAALIREHQGLPEALRKAPSALPLGPDVAFAESL
jgi:hypothetical protein